MEGGEHFFEVSLRGGGPIFCTATEGGEAIYALNLMGGRRDFKVTFAVIGMMMVVVMLMMMMNNDDKQ